MLINLWVMRMTTYEAGMKHHEYRELVNTLTKIAREYGQTQQLRERIAHALPFDCDATDAPSACCRKNGRMALCAIGKLRC